VCVGARGRVCVLCVLVCVCVCVCLVVCVWVRARACVNVDRSVFAKPSCACIISSHADCNARQTDTHLLLFYERLVSCLAQLTAQTKQGPPHSVGLKNVSHLF